ncbi:MAG TPA: exodeoxyribonuclease VII large subunit [Thermomicrobiaceae bacterium]|nr:exodeoxyribonuclease VII large subunit [Thermomicrobiaceae bacterium]
MRVLDVAELTAYIKDLLDSDPILGDVWVRGEISNFTRSAAGHLYFSLKAANVQLKCVCFRGNARYLGFQPANGDAVIARGNVSLYEATGQYQLYVELLLPEGTGIAQVQFEQLRQQLEREGLFEPSRKRPLPVHPRCIGVVTSASGAVWHDIQSVLSRRYPLCELILAPSLVQGADAPPAIVAALEALQDDGRAEVIVVARGGGSAEDLWCFNDERVARAVFACAVPVVSAIGHETDFTICDYVADLRAPTPSAAAELLAPHVRELSAQVSELHRRMLEAMRERLLEQRDRLADTQDRLLRRGPSGAIATERQALDAAGERMRELLLGWIAGERTRLAGVARELVLLHPEQVMERGYAMVLDPASGARVASATALSAGRDLLLRFYDGAASVKVESVEPGERHERALAQREEKR